MIKATYVEVPVQDLARASAFYQAVFQVTPASSFNDGTRDVVVLHHSENEVGLSLNCNPSAPAFTPGATGPLVYFQADGALAGFIQRARDAGGVIIEDRTEMGEGWYYAVLQDTEGNRFALSSEETGAPADTDADGA